MNSENILENNRGVKILGTGSYSPPLKITNDDLTKFLDTSDEWIYTRTGIKSRHYNEGRPNHIMAVEAAKRALENAKLCAAEIDYILVSTCTPDFFFPTTACIVQHEIGAVNAACLDINAACTGFVMGLDLARNLLYGGYDRVMLIASECLTNQLDFEDRTSCVLFGDEAGAVILERADKTFAACMKAKGVGVENPVLYSKTEYDLNSPFIDSEHTLPDYGKRVQMSGTDVYKFAVDAMPEAAKAACEKSGFSLDEIDLLIPHQANVRIIQTAVKTLGISSEKVHTNIETHGNTSSACMPVCLDDLNRSGKLKAGMKLCLVGFGAGLTYGSVVMEL
ncbi:MAG: ketoacyl-ACP synthase III [Oscillospiraceae bacterium]|nr:ketoacyl-ACP synthase III [Oscillospiraceae bacterium]